MFINKTVFSIGLAINLKRHHYTETRLISSVKRYGDRIIWGDSEPACVITKSIYPKPRLMFSHFLFCLLNITNSSDSIPPH